MAKLTKVINGRYVGPDKYKITDTNDGKKQIIFSPDSILEEGTPIGAEILNEIQNNGLYYLIGTHRVDGQESIYDCTLEGIDSFEFTQLCVLFKPDTAPTQSTIKLNISGQVYTLTGAKILNANQLGLILVKSELNAYVWSNYIKIVNDLTTGGANYALAAEQGVILNKKIDSLNICPYNVGDIFHTTNATNPSTVWLGTTWQKIEGRMLLGTSGSGASKATGGSNTATLSTANLPSHTHSASQSAHTHSQATHFHYVFNNDSGGNAVSSSTYATKNGPSGIYADYNMKGTANGAVNGKTSNNGGETTGSATPGISVGATGSGSAFSILSAYYTVHIWLRTA